MIEDRNNVLTDATVVIGHYEDIVNAKDVDYGYIDLRVDGPSQLQAVDTPGYISIDKYEVLPSMRPPPPPSINTEETRRRRRITIRQCMKKRTIFMMTIINTVMICVVVSLVIVLFMSRAEVIATNTPATAAAENKAQPFRHNGYAYNVTPERMTWRDSRAYCQQIGGDLAAIGMKTYRLRRMISSYLELDDVHMVWVGAYDLHWEGDWLWVDGSPVDVDTAQWRIGNPNDARHFGEQDCAVIHPKLFRDELNDDQCFNQHLAICETRLFD